MCTCGLKSLKRDTGDDGSAPGISFCRGATHTPEIHNPHFASRWRRWEDASILGRENASQKSAGAGLTMSTSTWSMSTNTQLAVWYGTQVLWRRPFRTAAMAHKKLFTSQAAAGKSFYCASPSAAAGKYAQMLRRRPAATMMQKRSEWEFGTFGWLLEAIQFYNSIAPCWLWDLL